MARRQRDHAAFERWLADKRPGAGPRPSDPIVLGDWQHAWLRSLFGEDDAQGWAREAVWSAGRGSAKSSLSAWVGLAAVAGVLPSLPSGEREVIVVSRTESQALRTVGRALALMRANGMLEDRATWLASPTRGRIEHRPSGSVMVAVSADAGTARGGAPSLTVLDEAGVIASGGRGALGPAGEASLLQTLRTAAAKTSPSAIIWASTAPPPGATRTAFGRLVELAREGRLPEGIRASIHQAPDGADVRDLEAFSTANPHAAAGLVDISRAIAEGVQAELDGPAALAEWRAHYHNVQDELADDSETLMSEADLGALMGRQPPIAIPADVMGLAAAVARRDLGAVAIRLGPIISVHVFVAGAGEWAPELGMEHVGEGELGSGAIMDIAARAEASSGIEIAAAVVEPRARASVLAGGAPESTVGLLQATHAVEAGAGELAAVSLQGNRAVAAEALGRARVRWRTDGARELDFRATGSLAPVALAILAAASLPG